LIAADTSSLSAFLEGDTGDDVDAVDRALDETRLLLPPVVVTELTSSPHLRGADASAIVAIPMLPITEGYWLRAGALRAAVLRRGHKARLADVLIAQSCIDADVALITRDRDFRHYVSAGLRITP
jgi:predicted nucleic acid-binding protein